MIPARRSAVTLLRVLAPLLLVIASACGDDEDEPGPGQVADTGEDAPSNNGADVDAGANNAEDAAPDAPELPLGSVPLAADSPWPKFRRDAAQTGRTDAVPSDDGAALWRFATGKGIFSSPVIGGDGTIYIGSADRRFYALNPDGTERWSFPTGEIIDSAALLDDGGAVTFGSGDGYLYSLDAQTGALRWSFQADDPAERGAFIRWFEGNVAIGVDGTLIAPNDNFRVYGVDRATGQRRWHIDMPDQTWSLPAVDVDTGRLYGGNNNVISLLDNTFGWNHDGTPRWGTSSLGSVAASVTLVRGKAVVGSFDGFVRALDTETGDEVWSFPTRDHVYASAALLSDDAILVPSSDGSVYALEPDTGAQRWAFDWGAPIRSSPAVDGEDRSYVGTGDGHLLVLNADGTLRWALRLIDGDRDDLNASPALGAHAIYIAGESGEVFGVPADFCLRPEEANNPACTLGPAEPLPADADLLAFTTPFGTALNSTPDAIDAHRALAFTLQVRRGGETVNAFLDDQNIAVTVTPEVPLDVHVSADRRFVTLAPQPAFIPDAEGNIQVTIAADILTDADRVGLRFTGGTRLGRVERTLTFALRPAPGAPLPYAIPAVPGDDNGVLEFHRLAAPLPTLLPSYNQIGFDSLHYLIGFVEGSEERAVAWLVEGAPDAEGNIRVIPGTRGMFPFEVRYDGGRLTLLNQDGLVLEVLTVAINFDTFRLDATVEADGTVSEAATVSATTVCGGIPLYGLFLRQLGLCNPQTDLLNAWGAALLRPWQGPRATTAALGEVALDITAEGATATFTNTTLRPDEHSIALLLVDADTGRPVSLDYGPRITRTTQPDGTLHTVSLAWPRGSVPANLRVWVMVDAWPAWRGGVE